MEASRPVSAERHEAILVWAGLALPVPGGEPEQDFAVVIEDGKVADCGCRSDLEARYPRAERCGSESYALLPALVNCHDHGRGLGTARLGVPDDILEVWLIYLRAVAQQDPYLAAAYDGARLARSGVGTVVHSHNPRDLRNLGDEAAATIKGYRDAGLRVAFHLPILDRCPLVYHNENQFLAMLPADLRASVRTLAQPPLLPVREYWNLSYDVLKAHHDPLSHLVHVQVGPMNAIWCSDQLLTEATAFARRHGTRVHMHLLETRYQAEYARRRWRNTFIRHLDRIGVLGPWLTLAHVVWPDKGDIELLVERGVAIVFNPSSNLRLCSGVPPIGPVMASGAVVGIGLDGLAFDDDQDYLRDLRLAWRIAKQSARGKPATANEVWRAACRGGAIAAFGDSVPLGTLMPGQLADLVLVDIGRTADMVSAEDLLSRAQRRHVRHLMVDGRWIVRNARATRVDEQELLKALWDDVPADHLPRLRELRSRVEAVAPAIRAFYARWDENKVKARI